MSHTELEDLGERAEGVCLVLHTGIEGVGERTGGWVWVTPRTGGEGRGLGEWF